MEWPPVLPIPQPWPGLRLAVQKEHNIEASGMTCRETWFGEQAASYCTISSHSSSSSNFPIGLPPLKKTSIKKKCQKGTPQGFLFGCFSLFGQANGKITIKFRITQCPEKIKFVCHLWTYGELYPLQIVVLMVVMRLCTGP